MSTSQVFALSEGGLHVLVEKVVVNEVHPPVQCLDQHSRHFSLRAYIVTIEYSWNAVFENITCDFIASHVLLERIEEDAFVSWAECGPVVERDSMAFFFWNQLIRAIDEACCKMHTPATPRLVFLSVAYQQVAPLRELTR